MKNILLYFLVITASIRGSFIARFNHYITTKKFRIPKGKSPEFFTDQASAIIRAERLAHEHNIAWHVISPLPDKFCAVSEKYINMNPQFKSLYTCNP